jgi:Na+/proline symporter
MDKQLTVELKLRKTLVSGPFWYAAGATIQVLLFGIIAIQVKRYAPTAHTVCEIIDARWGSNVHKVYIYFCFLTNIIVTAMLILGGAATVNALTGMASTLNRPVCTECTAVPVHTRRILFPDPPVSLHTST